MSCCFSTENRSGTTNTAFSPNCLAATASPIPVLPAVGSTTVPPPHVAAFEHAFEHVLPDAVLDARTGVERLQLRVHRHRVRGVVYPNERRLPDRLQHRRQGLPMGRHVAAIVAGSFVCFHGCVGLPLSPFAVIIAGTRRRRFRIRRRVPGIEQTYAPRPVPKRYERDRCAGRRDGRPSGRSRARRAGGGDSRRRCLRDRPWARSRHGRGEDRRRTRRKVRDGPRRRTDRDRHGSVRRVPSRCCATRRPRSRAQALQRLHPEATLTIGPRPTRGSTTT